MREHTLQRIPTRRAFAWLLCLSCLVSIFLTGCGGGGSTSGSGSGSSSVSSAAASVSTLISGQVSTPLVSLPTVSGAANAVSVTVEKWLSNKYVPNQPYVSVTVCVPGSSPAQCQTIDHVLIDTGSVGLRILSSALSSSFQLNMVRNANNLPVLSCVTYLDGSYTWGPLVDAYVQIGGETISNLPMQVVGQTGFNAYGSQCSSSGTAITTASSLGANGILGVGLWTQDCGNTCDPSLGNVSNNGRYFACTTNSCTAVQGTTLATASQVQNPVNAFSVNNNGLALTMNAPTSTGQSTGSGTLYFGLGTQANNTFGSSYTVLPTNGSGYIKTIVAANNSAGIVAGTKTSSFIDSGSNGLYFDSTLTTCSGATYFDCPDVSSPVTFTVTLAGATGSNNKSATVTVSNPLTAFGNYYAAIPQLAGDVGNSDMFDWGLPFFYGRTVVLGINGKSYPNGFGSATTYVGPYFAF